MKHPQNTHETPTKHPLNIHKTPIFVVSPMFFFGVPTIPRPPGHPMPRLMLRRQLEALMKALRRIQRSAQAHLRLALPWAREDNGKSWTMKKIDVYNCVYIYSIHIMTMYKILYV
jgi:hypothetical protein